MVKNFDECEATSRLETPISFRSLMNDGCAEFSIKSEDILEGEEDTDMERTYSPEKLECFSSAYLNEPYEDNEDEPENDGGNGEVVDFANFRKRMTNVRDDGKLMKMIERPGSDGLIPDDDDNWTVYMHYAGYIEYADYTFDATRLRQKKPVKLRLDELLPGVRLAVQTMRRGEKSKFLIHPDLGFGERGVPPRIPKNETLLYEIELFDFVHDEEQPHTNENMPKESYLDKIEKARKFRERGNKKKKIGKDVNGAIQQYRQGISILVQAHMANEEEEAEVRQELIKLYANIAVTHLSKKDYRRVCIAYKDAVHDCQALASNHVKLNYVSAKALRFLGDFNEAKNRIRRANRLKPGDSDIVNEIGELEEAIKKHKMEETRSARRMFGFVPVASSSKDRNIDLSDEVSDDFKEVFDCFLTEFINDEEIRVQQLPACSLAEKTYCQRMCRNKNISIKEVGSVGEKQLIFTKYC